MTNQTCAQIDSDRDKWQSLHPVIHTEAFEVKPEGREQTGWNREADFRLHKRRKMGEYEHCQRHTKVYDTHLQHTLTCNHANFDLIL